MGLDSETREEIARAVQDGVERAMKGDDIGWRDSPSRHMERVKSSYNITSHDRELPEDGVLPERRLSYRQRQELKESHPDWNREDWEAYERDVRGW